MDIISIVKLDAASITDAVLRAVNVIKKGGVVMHATETCYGFAADYFEESALEKLYAIKKMTREKPVSMMVSDLSMAKDYAEFNELALRLANEFWPGPLTLILPSEKLNQSVGVRCPDHIISKALIEKYGSPLTTTSANITTLPEVYLVEDFLKQVQGEAFLPDLILDSGELEKNPPSTIVKIDGNSITVIRKGALYNEIMKRVDVVE